MRPGIRQACEAGGKHRRDRRQDENCRGNDEQRQYSHLHVGGLDLLAEIFGRAANDQLGDEDSNQGKEQHPKKTRAGSADDHLIQHHIGHDHAAAERREAVMHGI